MAVKARPLASLSPAYRARIERAIARAEAAGEPPPSRSKARGHAPRSGKKESEQRRERERARKETTGELTSADRAYVKRWLAREYEPRNKDGPEGEEALDIALDVLRRTGRYHFEQQMAMKRQYRQTGLGPGMGYLVSLVDAEGFPAVHWYFYH